MEPQAGVRGGRMRQVLWERGFMELRILAGLLQRSQVTGVWVCPDWWKIIRDIRLDVYWGEIKIFNFVRYIAKENLSVLSSRVPNKQGWEFRK